MSTKINISYNPAYTVNANSKGNTTNNIVPGTPNDEMWQEEPATVEISSDGMKIYNESMAKDLENANGSGSKII